MEALAADQEMAWRGLSARMRQITVRRAQAGPEARETGLREGQEAQAVSVAQLMERREVQAPNLLGLPVLVAEAAVGLADTVLLPRAESEVPAETTAPAVQAAAAADPVQDKAVMEIKA